MLAKQAAMGRGEVRTPLACRFHALCITLPWMDSEICHQPCLAPREAVGAPETRSALPLMALMDPNFNGPALNVPRQAWKFPQHRKGLGDRLMFPSKGSLWTEMGKPTV